jgi:CBS domain-containing protein
MMNVTALMRTHPTTVSPAMSVQNLESLFLSSGFTGFPVVEDDRLVGVVSRSDIVRSLLTERSRAEQASSFYASMGPETSDAETESLDAIAAQVGVRLTRLKVEDVMIRNVVRVESSESIQSVAKLMRDGHLHRLPVVEGDRLIGLITSMDVVGAVAEGRLVEANTETLLEPAVKS